MPSCGLAGAAADIVDSNNAHITTLVTTVILFPRSTQPCADNADNAEKSIRTAIYCVPIRVTYENASTSKRQLAAGFWTIGA